MRTAARLSLSKRLFTINTNDMLGNVHAINFMNRRAMYSSYRKFGINKLELNLLSCLYAILMNRNITVISRAELFSTITQNKREHARMLGAFSGLVRLQAIGTYEYVSSPGNISIGLSDLGYSMLMEYESSMKDLLGRFSPHPNRLPGIGSQQDLKRYKPINIQAA
jgi:hypothetical protein